MHTDALLTRRSFVLRAALLSAGATVGSSLLAACSAPAPAPGASSSAKSEASQKLQLPTLQTVQGAKPDLVGTDIIPNGYTVYPKERFKAIATPPGKGGDVTLVTTFSNPVAPYDSNTLWQGVSKALNVNLKLNLVPFSDYSFGKFQTIVAGDDLPDLLFVPIGGVIPELPSFLEGKCADLTPFLSGDAVKEFPVPRHAADDVVEERGLQWQDLRRSDCPVRLLLGAVGPPEPARRGGRSDAQERRRLQAHAAGAQPTASGPVRHRVRSR